MIKKIVTLFIILLAAVGSSCTDFLDVSDELAEELDMEKIFSNPSRVRRFHREIYNGIPNTLSMSWWSEFTSLRGQSNIWVFHSDDLVKNVGVFPYLRPLTPTDVEISRWRYFRWIRQCNLFIENAVEIPLGGAADYIGGAELEELMTQAFFFRAYYHYLLFEAYGPIPIITESKDAGDPDLDFARNSVDEVVEFIYTELTDIMEKLPNPQLQDRTKLALPTKGTALAVRARLMMYAASPLFNGGYTEALSLVNTDGKRLFPDKDPGKWEKALEAVQEFIDFANQGHYELHKEYTDGIYDPDKSIYEVHMNYTKETILARSDDNIGVSTSFTLDKKAIPRGARGGNEISGGIGVTQELVDAFFMQDGLSIGESPLYTEEGYSLTGEDVTGQTEPGTHRMFINREPRFYQSVFYNGRKWHVGNEQIWFNYGGNSDRTTARSTKSGHSIYKKLSKKVYASGSHPRTEYRPPIVHRLAEFYLLYAEVLNEVNPNDSRIIEYVDKIRERAGVPLLVDIKPQVIGDQNAQREAIRHEMRVELCMEGQRYFDLKRWMIADDPDYLGKGCLHGPFYGMDMNARTLDGFYTRTVIHERVFQRQEYLLPLPQNEIQKSKLLVQNPGY